jgi:hypothetical protein
VLVAVFALVLGAGLTLLGVPEDIFPNLDVPVIYVAEVLQMTDNAGTVMNPEVEHSVRLADFERWLQAQGKSPAEEALKTERRGSGGR